jgi:hypothetical protein
MPPEAALTRCEKSRKHKGPFFNVAAEAREVGRGSRVPGYRRKRVWRVIACLCADCLKQTRIEVEGQKLVPAA